MLLQSALAVTILIQFSGSESIIESGCKGPGVFPHPYDSKQFLICANDHGKVFVAETAPCPEDYVFSVSEKTCVRGKQSQPASPPTKSRGTRAAEAGVCKSSGPSCDGCDRLVVCANMGGYVLKPIANISCSEIAPSMICNQASCTTSTDSNPNCDGSGQAGTFRCLQPGFFPDPNNCTLFHVCRSDLSHFSGECDEQYNATSEMCSNPEPEKPPSGPPSTTSPCNTAPLNWCKGNDTSPTALLNYPSYYVICIPVAKKSGTSTQLYQVSVVKCPEGQVYIKGKQLCETSCVGKRGRLPDPDSCRSYFECSKDTTAKRYCPENNAFDKDRKLCLPEFMVQGCQRTRSVETSTTIATTITQANALSSLPTTTKIIPSVGFQCRSSGLFPDESDCYGYISCSLESRSDGVYFRMSRKQCPFLHYFNPSGFCQLGFCWN